MKTSVVARILKGGFFGFIVRKGYFYLLAFFIVANLIFVFPRLMPSDPVELAMARALGVQGTAPIVGTEVAGGEMTASEYLRQMFREKFGVEAPLHVQYMVFWRRFLTFDFGISYMYYPETVASKVLYSLPWTLFLVIPVVPVGFYIGNWVGSRAGFHRDKLSYALFAFSNYLTRAPYYWFGLILVTFFMYLSQYLGVKIFPLRGAYSGVWLRPVLSFEFFLDALHHYILPFLSLIGAGVGSWATGMRAMTIYEAQSDYIQYSEQLGFRKGTLRAFARDNAILPNFTNLPGVLVGLISNTLLVEIVFGYPGVGTLLYYSVLHMDYPLIEATVLSLVVVSLIGNLIIDVCYGILDPRIGSGYAEEEM